MNPHPEGKRIQLKLADKLFLAALGVLLVLVIFCVDRSLQTVLLDVLYAAAILRGAVGVWQSQRRRTLLVVMVLLTIFSSVMWTYLVINYHWTEWAAVFGRA